MDAGCYTVSVLRYLIGTEPSSVVSAKCERTSDNPNIDLATDAVLEFPSADNSRKITGTFCASLNSSLFSFLSAPFTLKVWTASHQADARTRPSVGVSDRPPCTQAPRFQRQHRRSPGRPAPSP